MSKHRGLFLNLKIMHLGAISAYQMDGWPGSWGFIRWRKTCVWFICWWTCLPKSIFFSAAALNRCERETDLGFFSAGFCAILETESLDDFPEHRDFSNLARDLVFISGWHRVTVYLSFKPRHFWAPACARGLGTVPLCFVCLTTGRGITNLTSSRTEGIGRAHLSIWSFRRMWG